MFYLNCLSGIKLTAETDGVDSTEALQGLRLCTTKQKAVGYTVNLVEHLHLGS